ncbi:MAG: hypothetical protein PWP04_593, partial [Candidatus Atribacteria bacterium]|nr:hypothetical protein [Candidatus Atribacteria bacterium]
MIKIHVSRLEPGMVVGYSLLRDDGVVLLKEGVILTQPLINRLQTLGFDFIYIKDRRFSDIELEEVLSQDTRRKALETIHSNFYRIIEGDGQSLTPVKELVDEIIDEILRFKKPVLSLIQLRQHDDSVFSHSVNVAALGLMVGKFLKLPREHLRTLALGAIMHDLGKIKVPWEILNKPGKLSPEEWEVMKKHPSRSADFVAKAVSNQPEVALIAIQHHERIDGSGYPYGLSGEEINLLSRICAC